MIVVIILDILYHIIIIKNTGNICFFVNYNRIEYIIVMYKVKIKILRKEKYKQLFYE
jgi:hypothetical protein